MSNDAYIALDFPTWNQAETFIKKNDLGGTPVKVGMELFYREGAHVLEKLKKDNHKIFLDLKLHDIPTTVRKAMKNLAKYGVDIVNVHALGGKEMIHQAKEGLISGSSTNQETKLIAVTVLTSMDGAVLHQDLGISNSVNEYALHLAALTNDAGADGVVCSVHEANQIKEHCGSNFLTVTPGIRLAGTSNDDQKRVATPTFAKKHGADILVVGRTITQAEHPKKAYMQVLEECKNGNKS